VLAVEQARGERDRQRVHVENLRRLAIRSTASNEQLPSAEADLADREKRLGERLADLQRLIVVSPHAGIILEPPRRSTGETDLSLRQWQGSPLDPQNVGAFLETGALVCLVGDPARLEAVALVDQRDVDFVRAGQRVTLEIDLYPGEHMGGKVVELSPSRVDELPQELAARGDVPQSTDSMGRPAPLGKIYQARIQLETPHSPILIGTAGTARIHVAPRTPVARLARFIANTFRVGW
jgi:putative peptide zinc metalloprotease protein